MNVTDSFPLRRPRTIRLNEPIVIFKFLFTDQMKKLGLSWLLLLLWHITLAQLITVKDKYTDEKLEWVSILADGGIKQAITDFKGSVTASSFKGSRIIQFNRVGYISITISYKELEEKQFVILLEPVPLGLGEVVVTANRWSQMARNVPARIISIKKKDKELFNPQTAADLLASSGEVFIQKSQQAGGSPMIRGFSTNRLLYAVDGVRMNTAIFRAGNIQNVISLDAFALENTEVFFGPGSIAYGSDAIGGVMSFQTIQPTLSNDSLTKIRSNGTIRFSSVNREFTVNAALTYGKRKWAGYTGITRSTFGDIRMGATGNNHYTREFYVERINDTDRILTNTNPLVQIPSGYEQTNLTQKLRFIPSENWELNYALHYSETSSYGRYDRLIEKQSNGLPRFAVWNYGPQIWMMNLFSIQHNQANRWYDNMAIRIAHQLFQESRIDRGFNSFRLRTNLEKVNAYSINIDFEKKIKQHELIYGLEFVQNDIKSVGSGSDIRNGNPIPIPDRYPASQWNSYAAFASYQQTISEQLILQSGIRWNAYRLDADFTRLLSFYPFDFNKTLLKNQAATYSIGWVYKPRPSLTMKLNFSKGFRAPNVDDMGKLFDFVSGEVVVPNPDLKAEIANNVEIGFTGILGQFAKLDMTFFYTRLEKAMVRRPYQLNGKDSILYNGTVSKVYAIQNTAYSQVAGIQAGIEIVLSPHLRFVSKYNFQAGKEEMPNGEISAARHAAPGFGISQLTFRKKKLLQQIYCSYSEKVSFANLNLEERVKTAIYAKDANGQPYSPGWFTLNYKMNWQINELVRLGAGVENITDHRYRTYSSGISAGGRNFFISLRVGRG